LAERGAVKFHVRPKKKKARLPCLMCLQPPGWETKGKGPLLQCSDKKKPNKQQQKKKQHFCSSELPVLPRTFETVLRKK
jgi:hypothetical protein